MARPTKKPSPVTRTPKGQFAPGTSGNLLGRPKRHMMSDVLLQLLEKTAPKEFYVNGFEPLAEESLTLGEMICARMVYAAATGRDHPGLKSAIEIYNRAEGKVPLSVVHREPNQDEFVGLTEEDLDRKLAGYFERLKMLGDGSTTTQ